MTRLSKIIIMLAKLPKIALLFNILMITSSSVYSFSDNWEDPEWPNSNPLREGCNEDAQTLGVNGEITSRWGVVALIQIRYSRACQTAWTRIIKQNPGKNWCIRASINTSYGGWEGVTQHTWCEMTDGDRV